MSLLRKALLVNSAEFVCILIGVGLNIILTRTLGPDGIGQYAVVVSALTLAALVCCLGVPISFLYHCQNDRDGAGTYLVNALWMLTGLGLVGGAALVGLMVTQKGYFGVLPGFVLVMVLIYMPVALWQVLVRNTLLIEIQARRLSIMRLLRDCGGMLLVLLFLGFGFLKVPQAVVCFIVACFAPTVLGWLWLKSFADFSARPRFTVCRKLVIMGIRLNWADVMMVLNTQVSIFVVRYLFTDFKQVGYFSRGLRISMLAVTASQAVLPLLFSRWAAFPKEHLAAHVEKVMRFAGSMALAAIVVIVGAGKWVILIMYGVEFLPAVKPMMILVPGTMLYLLSRALMQLLCSRGLPEVSAAILFAATAVNAALSLILGPRMGITGVAIAATCANVVLLLLYVITVRKKFKVRISRCLVLNRSDILSIVEQLRSRKAQNVQ